MDKGAGRAERRRKPPRSLRRVALIVTGISGAIALAFAGAIYQTRTVADMSAAITEDAYMNPGLQGRGPAGGAPA